MGRCCYSVLEENRENSAVAKYLLLLTVFSTQSFHMYVHLTCEYSFTHILSRETLNNRCIEDDTSANYNATRSAIVEL